MGLCCTVIRESNIGVVESFGKYDRMIEPGCNYLNCITDSVKREVSLQLQTSSVKVETITKEQLSIVIDVGIQYKVLQSSDNMTSMSSSTYQKEHNEVLLYTDGVYNAVYKSANPLAQMSQFTNAFFRSITREYTMEGLFQSKNTLSDDLCHYLNMEMNKFGYYVHKVLIVDIDPPAHVKQSMNLVLESQNKREAAVNNAQAERETMILRAQATSETRRLEGEGLAKQRQAIANGLKESVSGICGKDFELDAEEVTRTILQMQYIDMLSRAAESGKNTFIINGNPGQGVEDSVRNAILSSRPPPENVEKSVKSTK